MAGTVECIFTITKDAYKLIKNGQAVLDSGGVRLLNGTLKELAVPAVKSAMSGGGPLSVVSTVSSLANNVQAGIIQHGVNQANQKLDVSLEKLSQIQSAVESLSQTKALGWASCSLGMLNCGISIAGFYMLSKKLDEVSNQLSIISTKLDHISQQIDDLDQKMTNREQSQYLETFNRMCMNIKSDADHFDRLGISQTAGRAEDHLNEIASFLKSVIRDFKDKHIDGTLGCYLIFSLAPAFAQEIKEYSARYFYEYGTYPSLYESWINVLKEIDSDSFWQYLKRFLQFDCLAIPLKDKQIAYNSAMYGTQYLLGDLAFNRQLTDKLDSYSYLHLDAVIQDKLQSDKFFEFKQDKEYVAIPI